MQTVSATCVAIALADKAGTLTVSARQGRFGPFVAIADEYGLIEVADTADEAEARIQSVRERIGA